MQKVAFIYPIIRTDSIGRSIETLLKFTPRKDMKIIVVDQSIEGISEDLRKQLYDQDDLYIRMRNKGFSTASNAGIIHALKAEIPYIAVVNDDTEFMYDGWFNDAIEEFKTDPNIIAICPESPRIAMWGYGLTPDKYVELIPYQDNFDPADIEFLKKGNYVEREQEIRTRHPFKIPDSFPFTKAGVIDAIAMWLPIFKREAFIELGLFEERFVWGGGEDYDMNARAYSCAYPIAREICDPKYHRRMVSTMKSWVWHWWGQSKDVKQTLNPELFKDLQPWNNNDQLWSPRIDVWGHIDGKPVKRRVPPQTNSI